MNEAVSCDNINIINMGNEVSKHERNENTHICMCMHDYKRSLAELSSLQW